MHTSTDAEIRQLLTQSPDWSGDQHALRAAWRFADHPSAVAFVVACTPSVEAAAHHPEWTIMYDRVSAVLSTHDAGDRVTERDLTLAPQLSERAKRCGGQTA